MDVQAVSQHTVLLLYRNVFGNAETHKKKTHIETQNIKKWVMHKQHERASEWHFIDNYNNIIFTFSQFIRRVYPKQLTNEDNGSNQNQQKSIDTQVL